MTKLGRLVKSGYIKTFEEIYTYSLPIKEVGIVDHILASKKEIELKDEVMKIKPVQKQTKAGQRTRFKAVVAVGDMAGHIGLGVKLAKEVQLAIRGALAQAKQRLVPVKLGWWGNKIGNAHTVPCKVTGKGGSVRVRLVPAPRGTGIVAAPVSKKLIQLAGVGDVFTSSSGSTKTMENFAKATYDALGHTYKFLMPEMWDKAVEKEHPFAEYTDQLQALADKKFF